MVPEGLGTPLVGPAIGTKALGVHREVKANVLLPSVVLCQGDNKQLISWVFWIYHWDGQPFTCALHSFSWHYFRKTKKRQKFTHPRLEDRHWWHTLRHSPFLKTWPGSGGFSLAPAPSGCTWPTTVLHNPQQTPESLLSTSLKGELKAEALRRIRHQLYWRLVVENNYKLLKYTQSRLNPGLTQAFNVSWWWGACP